MRPRGDTGMSRRTTIVALLAGLHGAALPAAAQDRSGPDRPTDRKGTALRLRNDLTEGRLSVYQIRRAIRRTVPRPLHTETLSYTQVAELVWFQGRESRPGELSIAQMVHDTPAKVAAFFRGERRVEPTPDADALQLLTGATRLHTGAQTYQDAPMLLPLLDPALMAMLEALLDVHHWPATAKRIGDRWQRDIALAGFRGTQTMTLAQVFRKEGARVAAIEMVVEGEMTAAAAEAGYRFVSGTGLINWSPASRQVVGIAAEASWEHGVGPTARRFDMKVDVQRVRSDVLNESELLSVRRQLADFIRLLKDHRAGRNKEALARCAAYAAAWPGSIWQPVVDEMCGAARSAEQGAERLTESELKESILNFLARYEAADQARDEEVRRVLADKWAEFVDRHRPGLLRLLDHEDERVRATAVFSLAFGATPANQARVEACARDSSPKVRSWAARGLAVRRTPPTDSALLTDLLRDADPDVRSRACAAVAACYPRHAPQLDPLRRPLVDLLLRDRADRVRRSAAEALGEIGSTAELDAMRRARKHEVERTMRRAVDDAIRRIEQRG